MWLWVLVAALADPKRRVSAAFPPASVQPSAQASIVAPVCSAASAVEQAGFVALAGSPVLVAALAGFRASPLAPVVLPVSAAPMERACSRAACSDAPPERAASNSGARW